ncbi:MAG: damage-inducible protein [Sphingomonadaceae bacterium]|nr:damage-inducible protein [Sphingomonadaceae bacterium]
MPPLNLIADLRARVAALESPSARGGCGVLPFGVPVLDRALPDGGLRLGATHEIREGGPGAAQAHAAAATLFAAAAAARTDKPVLWVTPARDLFAPGLAGVGLHPDRLIVVEARSATGVLGLIEEGLRCPALGTVVGEARSVSLAQSRRLQLAAEASGVMALMLLRWSAADAPSAAQTRWRVACVQSAPLGMPGVGRARWQVELLRCRGTEGAMFTMEAADAQGHLALAPDLVDRPLARRAA